MQAIAQAYLLAAAAVLGYMTVWYLIALVRKRNDLADTAWGLGFIMIAVLALLGQVPVSPRLGLVAALVLAWGVRLAMHVYSRNRGKAEDFRYAAAVRLGRADAREDRWPRSRAGPNTRRARACSCRCRRRRGDPRARRFEVPYVTPILPSGGKSSPSSSAEPIIGQMA